MVDRLDRIYAYPKPTDYLDRFLAVTLSGHPHGYVQCMFIRNRTGILCEASSGYYFNREGTPRTFFLSREAIAALGRLGFSTDDSKGNFRNKGALNAGADLNAIADRFSVHDGTVCALATKNVKRLFAARNSKCVPVSEGPCHLGFTVG